MQVQVRNKIGGTEYIFNIDDDDDVEALLKAAFLGTPHTSCGLCGSKDLALSGNRAKGFTFIKVRCLNPECGAYRQLGQYVDGGYFWKAWERYVPDEAPEPKGKDKEPVKPDEVPV